MTPDAPLDCLVAGEANVDLLMNGVVNLIPGEEQLAHGMDLVLGGSSAITAYNLARLGRQVGLAAVVGADAFGDFVEARLRSAGVDVAGLRRHTTARTGITVWHSKGLKRAGVTFTGSLALLRPRDVLAAGLRRARHLHVGHYFLLENLHSGAPGLFRRARAMGLTTSLDCNHDPSGKWDSNLLSTLRHTDFFFPNEAEAMAITNERGAEQAARQLGRIVPAVVVKMGARGVYLFVRGRGWRAPAKRVRAVDTTGAGDSFNAGFLASMLGGGTVDECATSGVRAAARCVARVGGTAAFEAGR